MKYLHCHTYTGIAANVSPSARVLWLQFSIYFKILLFRSFSLYNIFLHNICWFQKVWIQ